MKRKTIGQKIADKYEKAKDKQRVDYEWATMSGRNPFEYGMKTDKQLLAKLIDDDLLERGITE